MKLIKKAGLAALILTTQFSAQAVSSYSILPIFTTIFGLGITGYAVSTCCGSKQKNKTIGLQKEFENAITPEQINIKDLISTYKRDIDYQRLILALVRGNFHLANALLDEGFAVKTKLFWGNDDNLYRFVALTIQHDPEFENKHAHKILETKSCFFDHTPPSTEASYLKKKRGIKNIFLSLFFYGNIPAFYCIKKFYPKINTYLHSLTKDSQKEFFHFPIPSTSKFHIEKQIKLIAHVHYAMQQEANFKHYGQWGIDSDNKIITPDDAYLTYFKEYIDLLHSDKDVAGFKFYCDNNNRNELTAYVHSGSKSKPDHTYNFVINSAELPEIKKYVEQKINNRNEAVVMILTKKLFNK